MRIVKGIAGVLCVVLAIAFVVLPVWEHLAHPGEHLAHTAGFGFTTKLLTHVLMATAFGYVAFVLLKPRGGAGAKR